MKFSVDLLYEANHPQPESVPFHSHQCYEIVLYKRGEGTVQIEDSIYRYGVDSVVLVSPGVRHNEINFAKSQNFVLGFHPEDDVLLPPDGLYHVNARYSLLFSSMLTEIVEQQPYFKEMLSYQVGEIILGLLRQLNEEKTKIDLSYIIKYIDENFMMPIDVGYFAKMYHYSYDRFRHIFKEKTGMSPQDYILFRRLSRAKELLVSSNEKVTDISLECGFYDASQFSKMFKREYNLTPLQYRNNICKKA